MGDQAPKGHTTHELAAPWVALLLLANVLSSVGISLVNKAALTQGCDILWLLAANFATWGYITVGC